MIFFKVQKKTAEIAFAHFFLLLLTFSDLTFFGFLFPSYKSKDE
jgi:hypothetical protein